VADGVLLRVDGLDKTYGKGDAATHALRAVSFEFGEGEFGAIIGQSGSGKSTMLNQLGLLDTPSAGVIEYRGTDVGKLGKPARAKLRNDLIGFVFQFHYLLPEFSVIDNPTGNLDTVNTQQVYDLFRKINEERGTAFLIVTHDRNVAQRADRILEVSDGLLVQDVRNQYAQR